MSCSCFQVAPVGTLPFINDDREVRYVLDAIVSKIEQDSCEGSVRTPPRSQQAMPPPYSPPPRLGEVATPGRGQYSVDLPRQEHIQPLSDRDVARALFVEDRVGVPLTEDEDMDYNDCDPDPRWIISSSHDTLVEMGSGNVAMSRCSLCEFSVEDICSREGVDDGCLWRCCGNEADVSPEYVCTSCTYQGSSCQDCGVSETYYQACQRSRWYRETGEWLYYSTQWGFIPVDYNNQELVVCPHCACNGPSLCDYDIYSEVEFHQFNITNDAWWGAEPEIWSDEENYITGAEDTYLGEYENEELPVNNSEKMVAVKSAVQDVGEFVFDLQDKLPEGDYLNLMNLLQKITNAANQ